MAQNKKKQKEERLEQARINRYRSLVDVGTALSSEKELARILDLILDKAIENTDAEAASIFLTENIRLDTIGNTQKKFIPVLRFHRSSNRTMGKTSHNKVLQFDKSSIAGYVALTGKSVRADDCYKLPPDVGFEFNPEIDRELKYYTKSMLAVPMLTAGGKIRGVLQLINKLDHEALDTIQSGVLPPPEQIHPFTDEDENLMRAFASQACVAIENAKLTEDIENLFESFIRASVTAIEARDPATSGHSDRVAVLTVEFARHVHMAPSGPFKNFSFSDEQIREIRYAALLHDFGKIGVRESVLSKEKKLYPHELETILLRLDSARAKQEMLVWKEMAHELADLLKTGNMHDPHFRLTQVSKKVDQFSQHLNQIRMAIINANQPQVLGSDFDIGKLMGWLNQTSFDLGQQLVTPEEIVKLSLPKGTLSELERREIESHVSHTYKFLRQIAWTEDLSHVADIAHAHHEKNDGSGYPRGLISEHIPLQSKMMAISDIYDALTAMDRPYKPAVSVDRALDILHMEAKEGKLDLDLLQIFIEAGTYMSVDGMRSRKAG